MLLESVRWYVCWMNRKRLCACSQFLKHSFAIYWFFYIFFPVPWADIPFSSPPWCSICLLFFSAHVFCHTLDIYLSFYYFTRDCFFSLFSLSLIHHFITLIFCVYNFYVQLGYDTDLCYTHSQTVLFFLCLCMLRDTSRVRLYLCVCVCVNGFCI